jgi:hypothetical protein
MARGVVMQIVSLIQGGATPFDGQFLVEYDPDRADTAPDGSPMLARILTTPALGAAKRWPSHMEALAEWKRESTRWPRRADGKPNRPLTAFTVEIAPPEKFS